LKETCETTSYVGDKMRHSDIYESCVDSGTLPYETMPNIKLPLVTKSDVSK